MHFLFFFHSRRVNSFLALALVSGALLSVSCNKNLVEDPSVGAASDEVVFLTNGSGPSYNVTTKATVVNETSLNTSGFNVSATTGAAGAETAVWTSQPFTLGEGVFSGNKWWPSTDPGYHFFASNASLTHTSDGNTVAASNDVDVVAAYLPSPTYKAVNTLQFEHVFARLGSVTITAESGYTISNVSVRITPKVSGTYNLKTGYGVTDGSAGWSSVVEAASPSVIASQVGANANDLYLVPGTYDLKVTWTATVGDYSQTFTDMPAEVSLTAGKVSSFTAELGGLAKQVQFRISVTPWDEEPTAQVSVPKRDMLTFTVVTPGKILWKKSSAGDAVTLQYSKNGVVWTNITATTAGAEIAVAAGDVLKFKGTGPTGIDTSNYCYFGVADGATFNATGSVMSLIGGDDFVLSDYCFYQLFKDCLGLLSAPELPATILVESCYYEMFRGCTGLTIAPELPSTTLASYCYSGMFQGCTALTRAPELPATTLAPGCYNYLFYDCTGLTTAPELPATNLAQSCYNFMFGGCTGLTSAPELPATTLANYCYRGMFYGCTGLTSAPELPATTLADYCYYNMFQVCRGLSVAPELPATSLAQSCYREMFRGCEGLTSAPELLPATTLASSCYQQMFQSCTGLISAPELPATSLASECYYYMFNDCRSLSNVKCLATDISAPNCLYNWLSGVSAAGTFKKAAGVSYPSGNSGIPSGWTVEEI